MGEQRNEGLRAGATRVNAGPGQACVRFLDTQCQRGTDYGPCGEPARAGWDVRYLCADGEHLPFVDKSFDYVYSFGVMHHAADTQGCINEAHRVLREGGQALIMLYHRRSLNELVHRLLRIPFEERKELCPVVRRFTKTEVRRMFASFRDVQVHSDFVFGEGYGVVFRLAPRPLYRLLSRMLGWHLMIRATR